MSFYLITTINEEYKVIKPDIDSSDLYEIMNKMIKSIKSINDVYRINYFNLSL